LSSQYPHIYNGLGDRLQSVENGTATTYHLDLAAGLTQVLDDGQHTYLYGNGRIGYSSEDMYYFLGDALGSVRAVVEGDGEAPVVMTRDYAPYGEVLAGQGTNPTPYGFTGEWTSIPIDFAYMIVRVIPVRTSGRCPYGNDTASYCVARTARPAFCSFCGAEQP